MPLSFQHPLSPLIPIPHNVSTLPGQSFLRLDRKHLVGESLSNIPTVPATFVSFYDTSTDIPPVEVEWVVG